MLLPGHFPSLEVASLRRLQKGLGREGGSSAASQTLPDSQLCLRAPSELKYIYIYIIYIYDIIFLLY